MKREFFVLAREVCDECGGSGFVIQPDWAEYSAKIDGNPIEWFRARGWDVHRDEDLPPEEILCEACNGEGRRQVEVPLADAIKELLS